MFSIGGGASQHSMVSDALLFGEGGRAMRYDDAKSNTDESYELHLFLRETPATKQRDIITNWNGRKIVVIEGIRIAEATFLFLSSRFLLSYLPSPLPPTPQCK